MDGETIPDTSLRCDGCGEPCASNAPDFMVRPDYWRPGRLVKGHINCVDSLWRPEDFEDTAGADDGARGEGSWWTG